MNKTRTASLLAVAIAITSCIAPPASPPLDPPASASSSAAPAAIAPPIEVAVTVDDLPIHGPAFPGIDRLKIAEDLLTAFRAHHLPPVYGFVNGKKVDDNPATLAILRRWVEAGNPLGNHTYGHVSLNELDVPAYLADLEKGEAILKQLVPDEATWRVYRYPFLFEGTTLEKHDAVRRYLAEHRYAIAEVTIDGDDWAWNPPFARCSERRDLAALRALRRGYVETHLSELRYARELTRQIAGRDVKHVLLLHIGAADADAIDALLTAYEKEGVRWIDLRTALADPFYADDPHLATKAGAAFPYPLAKSKGITRPPLPKRPAEDALESTCR